MHRVLNAGFLAMALLLAGRPAFSAEVAAASPHHLWGVAFNVDDLERSVKYYAEIVGLKVAFVVPADAKSLKDAKEVIMSFDGAMHGTTITLAHLEAKAPPAAKTAYGRVLFYSTDASGVAARAKAAGYAVRQIGDRPEYFIKDPDGFDVEFFQPRANSPFFQKP